MDEDKKDFENSQDVEWVMPEFEELTKNYEIVYGNEKEEKNQDEVEERERQKKEQLEKIEKEIEEKEKEIEQIQIILDYHESGEAYRENEEKFSNGMIDEKEYEETKRQIDEEFDNARENILIVKDELKDLLSQKEKITGIKQKDITEQEKLEDLVEQKEELKSNGEMKKPSKNIEEKENSNGDTEQNKNNSTSNKENAQLSNNLENNQQSEQTEQSPVQEQEMQVYRRPNRLLEFIKKSIEKIKHIIKMDNKENFEEAVAEQLNNEGYNVNKTQLENVNLGDELSNYVYSNNEIIQNYNKRDILEDKDLSKERSHTKKEVR